MQIFGKETQETIAAWALATFGDVKSTRSILTRANCEMAELVHAVECGAPTEKIASEIADVIIVLCRYPVDITWLCKVVGTLEDHLEEVAYHMNQSLSGGWSAGNNHVAHLVTELHGAAQALGIDLPAAIDAKMAINRARKWESKGAGHGQHARFETGAESDTLRLAAEYKAACAAIPNQATAYHVDRGTGNFDVEAVAAYHVAITRAGNARRALLAHVAGDTPEVAP
jgi:hypothetical protein